MTEHEQDAPLDKYTVICDETNNSEESLRQGFLNVYIAKPRKTITVNVVITKQGVSFPDLGELT